MNDLELRTDAPLNPEAWGQLYELEKRAVALYRAEYADGPFWRELHGDTRQRWVELAERQTPNVELGSSEALKAAVRASG